jgi:threonine aldolase
MVDDGGRDLTMVVDLRSDTLTKPTPGMRRAMADAEVGDDVYGEDPTVNRLQEEAAQRFGREAALYVPSGVMANLLWTRVLCPTGSEVVIERYGHAVAYEEGAGAANVGVQYLTIDGDRGTAGRRPGAREPAPGALPVPRRGDDRRRGDHQPRGGAIHGLERLQGLRAVADERGAAFHLDGLGCSTPWSPPGRTRGVRGGGDGLNFCLSKGLGAPVGSVMVGDADAIAEARLWRRASAGDAPGRVLAAAGLYALEHHVDRLAEDHANARLIAERLADRVPGSAEPDEVPTNIMFVDTGSGTRWRSRGRSWRRVCGARRWTSHSIRLVTHLDVTTEQCRAAADVIADILEDRDPTPLTD